MSVGQGDDLPKLEVFIKFDELNYWLSRIRDLINAAETYNYAAYRASYRELRNESRNAEIALLTALFEFDQAMKGATNDSTQGQ
jgi:hypothetical protein